MPPHGVDRERSRLRVESRQQALPPARIAKSLDVRSAVVGFLVGLAAFLLLKERPAAPPKPSLAIESVSQLPLNVDKQPVPSVVPESGLIPPPLPAVVPAVALVKSSSPSSAPQGSKKKSKSSSAPVMPSHKEDDPEQKGIAQGNSSKQAAPDKLVKTATYKRVESEQWENVSKYKSVTVSNGIDTVGEYKPAVSAGQIDTVNYPPPM